MQALADAAVERFGAMHVVCNNAGVGGGGLSWEMPLSTWEWVLGVNLWGVIHGIRAFVPLLMQQDEAHIVNTASVAGLVAGPFMGPYNASKHAVVALSETLHHELAMTAPQVKVSVLCPGWVRHAHRRQCAQPAGCRRRRPRPPTLAARQLLQSVIENGHAACGARGDRCSTRSAPSSSGSSRTTRPSRSGGEFVNRRAQALIDRTNPTIRAPQ